VKKLEGRLFLFGRSLFYRGSFFFPPPYFPPFFLPGGFFFFLPSPFEYIYFHPPFAPFSRGSSSLWPFSDFPVPFPLRAFPRASLFCRRQPSPSPDGLFSDKIERGHFLPQSFFGFFLFFFDHFAKCIVGSVNLLHGGLLAFFGFFFIF